MTLFFSDSRCRANDLRPLFACAVWLALLATPLPATALQMDNLYTVEVQLDPQDPSSLNDAYNRAMAQVLVRMTGSAYASESEELAAIFSNAARYVLRRRPGPDNTLAVTFDGAAIESILRRSGHATWGSDRPVTLVWLAVDWGMGEREVIAAQDEDRSSASARSIDRHRLLRERVLKVAEQRGIPVIFPLLDAEDLTSISFSDIWAGFDDRLLTASSRYDVTSVLVGRVRTTGLGDDRWTWYLGDQVQSWAGEPEQVVNLVADSLAAQFAFSPNTRLETVRLTVAGVDSISAYGAVQRILGDLDLIEEFAVHSLAGSEIDYRVKAYGGKDRLSRALELTGVLERDPAPFDPFDDPQDPGDGGLEFVYRP